MMRRPPRSTLDRSSAAADVYKRQGFARVADAKGEDQAVQRNSSFRLDRGEQFGHRCVAEAVAVLQLPQMVGSVPCGKGEDVGGGFHGQVGIVEEHLDLLGAQALDVDRAAHAVTAQALWASGRAHYTEGRGCRLED